MQIARVVSAAAILGALLSVPLAAQRPDATWSALRQVFGADGSAEDGYLRFEFPRSDLTVVIGRHRLAPAFELTSYMSFVPTTPGHILALGEVVLTEAEAGPAFATARAEGVSVSAFHNHLLGESPRLLYMHVMMTGDARDVAVRLQHVLAKTGAGAKAAPAEPASDAGKRWSPATASLGAPAEARGTTAEWEFARREPLRVGGMPVRSSGAIETASEVVFQRLGGGRVATTGEIFLLPVEIDTVSQLLSGGGIHVTAIHNHMLTDLPQMYWLHWYATGDPATLARTIRSALAVTNHRQPVPQP